MPHFGQKLRDLNFAEIARATSHAQSVIRSAMMKANLTIKPIIFSTSNATAPAIKAAMISTRRKLMAIV